MSKRTMRFKTKPQSGNSPEFLMFMNLMSQSNLKIDFDSETNEILVEISSESSEELQKLLKAINKTFEITGFSSENNTQFLNKADVKESQIEATNSNFIVDFSYLTEECSEKAISKLCQTLHWACVRKNISEKDISRLFIWPIIKEISLYYANNVEEEFEVGDIVSLMNIIDDIQYSKGIVCNVTDKSFFIIPLVENLYAISFSEKDVTFFDKELYKKNYSITYEASKYISKKRVENVIGKVNPEYYEVILENLSTTFSFMKMTTGSNLPSSLGIQERALFVVFNLAFETLAKDRNFENFFTAIHITDNKLKDICMKCDEFDKANWHSITQLTTCTREELKASFKTWLDSQQDLKKICPTLSFTSLLKAIKKTINKQ